MRTLAFLDAEASPAVKGAIHGAVFALSAICLVYNVCAFLARRERHLAVNVAAYTAICALEIHQVAVHRS